MSDELSILITGKLAETDTKNIINDQIKILQSQLDKLHIGFNGEDLKKATADIKKLQDQIKFLTKGEEVLPPPKTSGFITSVNDAVNKVKKKLGKLNSIAANSLKFNEEGGLKSFIIQAEDATKQVHKFKYELDQAFQETKYNVYKPIETTIKDTKKLEKEVEKLKVELTSLSDAGNLAPERINAVKKSLNGIRDVSGLSRAKQAISELQDMDTIAQKIYETQVKREEEERKLEEAQAKATNKNVTQIKKEEQAQNELNQQIQETIANYQREAEIKATNLTERLGNNVNTSSLDKFLKDSKLLSASSLPELRNKMRNLNTDFKEISTNARNAGKRTLTFGDSMKQAMSKFPVWMAAATAFYFPLREFQNGLQMVKQLNDAMVNLKRITQDTSQQFQGFIASATKSANSVGAATTDFIDATSEFARLGYNLQKSQAMAKQAMTYANVGNMSQNNATTDLIASMKAFNIQADNEGKNMQKIVDMFSNVGDKEAITAKGLGDAMKRGGSALHDAGNTIQQSIALITAANSSIQDPAKVGTA